MINHMVNYSCMDVKELRKRLNMTSQELATALGVSISTVSRWETGKSKPSKLARSRLQELDGTTDGCRGSSRILLS